MKNQTSKIFLPALFGTILFAIPVLKSNAMAVCAYQPSTVQGCSGVACGTGANANQIVGTLNVSVNVSGTGCTPNPRQVAVINETPGATLPTYSACTGPNTQVSGSSYASGRVTWSRSNGSPNGSCQNYVNGSSNGAPASCCPGRGGTGSGTTTSTGTGTGGTGTGSGGSGPTTMTLTFSNINLTGSAAVSGINDGQGLRACTLRSASVIISGIANSCTNTNYNATSGNSATMGCSAMVPVLANGAQVTLRVYLVSPAAVPGTSDILGTQTFTVNVGGTPPSGQVNGGNISVDFR